MISEINNSPNFKAVYYKKSQFNKSQKIIASEILGEFRAPVLNQKHGVTYEILYENRGYDFIIKPYGDRDNVILFGNKKLKHDIEENTCHNDRNNFYIGIYNSKNPFNIKDVENGIQTKRSNERFFAIAALAAIVAFIFMPIKGCVNAIKGENFKKELPEITDTIKKSTNTIKSNILDLAKSIKKN